MLLESEELFTAYYAPDKGLNEAPGLMLGVYAFCFIVKQWLLRVLIFIEIIVK